ncbi:dephospho-CoA kinase [Candidatus Enterococcus mansonii]|uniref:Dephospho-CoA kinase n=1 Tax=Candidatus Enterococcus mansonii TaxID=1834181 RepID=A0A242CIV7_9ENTE|nr:dephospho-CoA kinase [Enterococcus sp. 4G2_DIV0659]OTO10166.1 dephospho-CoA kinase [Enterococcus sp. 4G2_DIV0659]
MGMILGLTGGIATGKSTVIAIFKEFGFPIVDADIIAREIVEPNSKGLEAIIENFGSTMIQSDGYLDRKKLGSLVFSDELKRKKLNEILSPFLREEITRQVEVKKKQAALVIVDIPLLYEGGYDLMVDQVAVVYTPEVIQLPRLMKRDGLSENEAKKRINSQLSIEEKKKKADIIFDNQGSQENLRQQVIDWLKQKKFIK